MRAVLRWLWALPLRCWRSLRRIFRRGRPEEPQSEQVSTGEVIDPSALVAAHVGQRKLPPAPSADFFFYEEPPKAVKLTARQETVLEQQQLIEQNPSQRLRELLWGVPMKDGRTARLLDEAVTSRVGEAALKSLIAVGPVVADRLRHAVPAVDARWPHEVIVQYDQGFMGYAISSIPTDFHEGHQLRSLAMLSARRDSRADVDLVLGLLHLIAQWLDVLHRSGVVFGDLKLDNIAYAPEGPAICPIDFLGARVLGSGNWRRAFGEGEKSLVTDRVAYAELVDVMLAATCAGPEHNPDGDWWDEFARSRPQIAARVHLLRSRAASDAGSPPNMQEWCGAFLID